MDESGVMEVVLDKNLLSGAYFLKLMNTEGEISQQRIRVIK